MDPRIQRLVAKIDKLPTLPVAATKIVQVVNNPNTTARDVNQLISTDQALAAKVLKLVNSAYYGLSNKVASITQAVVILGFNTIKSLALSASVLDSFSAAELGSFKRDEFWKHSLGVGVGAKLIAGLCRVPPKDQEEFFLAGLLHDMGKVVMDQYLHEEFSEVVGLTKDTGCSFLQAEREVLGGISHADIGKLLAEKWNLPANLQDAIAFHHDPLQAKDGATQTVAVHFANILCKSKHIGYSGDYEISGLNEQAVESLKIPPAALEKLIAEDIDREFKNATIFLNMATGK
ncbi:MAG TPA: HDOD domain-containing protein [bacterium]|nr:HDOD domain-containing protein [bacterium]